MSKYQLKNIDFVNSSVILGSPVVFSFLLWAHIAYEGFNAWLLIPAFILYYLTGLGITAGYHRLFAHRAYQAHPVVKFFLLVFGAGAVQNSAIKWSNDHRRHHTFVDTEKDPYNINEGFFYAHMGWILLKEQSDHVNHPPKDLTKDPMVMWQDRNYLLIVLVVALLIPVLIGYSMGSPIGGLAIIAFGRLLLVHHATFFINSLCHCLGNQPYTDENTARDSWFMALFTFGEGYHNFHHIFQADYRNGVKWYHFDPTKWLIDTLRVFGLAKNLRKTPDVKILEARMNMKMKRLKDKKPFFDVSQLEALRDQVAQAQKKWQTLKAEYKALKKRLPEDSAEKLEQFKLRVQKAKAEFKESYRLWVQSVRQSMDASMGTPA